MADKQGFGLTPFGWILAAGAGYYFLGNKTRRAKVMQSVKGYADKVTPSSSSTKL